MIAVVDYGAGNLMSVSNALGRLGLDHRTTSDRRDLLAAGAVILPGVGEFGRAAAELQRRGLTEALIEVANRGTPLLGICLGMQLLFETSQESPGAQGLALLPGRSLRFPALEGLKIPHMGWNSLAATGRGQLLKGLPPEPYMYFVHSYYVAADHRDHVIAQAGYGVPFDAAVERGNLFGCQFHPEKSGDLGFQILKNFAAIAGRA